MKNQILVFIVLFSCSSNLFSQENRSDRGWEDSNQNTYYMWGTDDADSEYRSESYPNSRVNNPDNNNWNNSVDHRTKAIWYFFKNNLFSNDSHSQKK